MSDSPEGRIARLEQGMNQVAESLALLTEANLQLAIAAKNSSNAEERTRGEEAFRCVGDLIERLEALEKLLPAKEGKSS